MPCIFEVSTLSHEAAIAGELAVQAFARTIIFQLAEVWPGTRADQPLEEAGT